MRLAVLTSCVSKLLLSLQLLALSIKVVSSEDLNDINAKLTEGVTVNEVDPTDWLKECVPPFRDAGFVQDIPYSNHYLIEEPSGLCAGFMSCSYKKCLLYDENTGVDPTTFDQETFNLALETPAALAELSKANVTNYYDDLNQTVLPELNLPSHISFPRNVKDISELVQFAASNCMTVSIKNGGHSYHGASTMKDSLQLNLRNLQKYSNTSVIICDDDADANNSTNSTNMGSHNNACKRATANGKPAVVRVGGGELWDEVYRAVFVTWNHNPANANQRLDVVGGGAGSVSSIGGWMQGGGESTGDERMYGFGADQVVELEMVLADSTHVKFGPTQWQEEEGILYPQTTLVEGQCNLNLVENESEWIWGDCTNTDIPFDKLWMAVRGGGGGTYGIVTSAYYQLHPHRPMYSIAPNVTNYATLYELCTATGTCEDIFHANARFFLDLLFDPSAIGVDEETSNSCGHPSISFTFPAVFCRNPDLVMIALENHTQTLAPTLSTDLAEALRGLFTVELIGSYGENSIETDPNSFMPLGKVADYPPPSTVSDQWASWSALIPAEFLKQKTDFVTDMAMIFVACHIIGGNAAIASDGMTAIPSPQRRAGLQTVIFDPIVEAQLRAAFAEFEPEPEEGMFPGGTEYNHLSNIMYGPLKSNWTQPCPDVWGLGDGEQQCVSAVESVWGTKLLAELEAIKRQVDPNNMFKCFRCVGENMESNCQVMMDDEEEEEEEEEQEQEQELEQEDEDEGEGEDEDEDEQGVSQNDGSNEGGPSGDESGSDGVGRGINVCWAAAVVAASAALLV